MSPLETEITTAIVEDILAAGHWIKVFGDGEGPDIFSNKFEEVMAAVGLCDTTQLVIPKVGTIYLVHGLDDEVISDHTDNPETVGFILRAEKIANADS